jgi:hypothetical protein
MCRDHDQKTQGPQYNQNKQYMCITNQNYDGTGKNIILIDVNNNGVWGQWIR